MIEGIIECLLPKTSELAKSLVQPHVNASNFLFALYLITHARTSLLGLSFFIAEIMGLTYGLGLYTYGYHIYIGSAIIAGYFAKLQLTKSRSLSIGFWCLALICLYGYAAYDAGHFPDTETGFYNAYTSILLCIHVCIILSFYNIRPILNNVVDKLCAFWRMLHSNYTVKYFCYTLSYRFKYRAERWNQQTQ